MAHYGSTIIHTVSTTQPPVAQNNYTQFYNMCYVPIDNKLHEKI